MTGKSVTISALCAASLGLAGCITERDHVLAPDARGVVIDAATDRPVEGARVRYQGVEGLQTVTTGPDGRFDLEGRTESRTIVALPVSGVFRDTTVVAVSAPGFMDGYASAAFINGLGPAEAEYPVTVVVFPANAPDTELHTLMEDCISGPEQSHALHLATHVGALDADNPPSWLDPDTAEALNEHLRVTVRSSDLLTCERMNEAHALLNAHRELLYAVSQSGRQQPFQ